VLCEIARRGCFRIDRRDDLEKGVADRHHRVSQAELFHPGIIESKVDTQNRAKVIDYRVEVAGHNNELTNSHGVSSR
jgi:hypothetical protein